MLIIGNANYPVSHVTITYTSRQVFSSILHKYTHTHTHTHTHIYICIYIYIYIHIHIYVYIYIYVYTLAFTQKNSGRKRTFFPFPLTHNHANVDLLAITRLITDEIYPYSGFVFNYIFTYVIYSRFKVINFSVIIDKAWIGILVLKTGQ